MSQNLQVMLIVIGLCLIAGLSWFILRMLKKERQVKSDQQARLQEVEAKAQEQRDYLLDSIRVISLAMQDEQCELAEGSIRIKVLLDHLAPFLHEHEDFSIFNEMFEATKHMPILDEWKKLKLRQRYELTMEREALEEKHKDAIIAASRKLAVYNFQH